MKKCPRCGKEYSDATAVCPEHGKPLSDSKDEMAPYLWFAKTSRMSGLILMALIGFFAVTMNRGFNLGFYSLLIISGPMIGIIAIINGHLAQASAKKLREQDRKKTSPVLGLITGYIGTLLTGTALMFAIFHPIKSRPTAINCASNLKNIGLAMRIYAVDHGNMLPKNLMEITNELPNPNTLICPDDPHHKEFSRGQAPFWSATNVSYEFLTPGAPDDEDPNRVMMRCPIHGWELMADGMVRKGNLKH